MNESSALGYTAGIIAIVIGILFIILAPTLAKWNNLIPTSLKKSAFEIRVLGIFGVIIGTGFIVVAALGR